MTTFKLGITELYWDKVHGPLRENEQFIHGHYLLHETISKSRMKTDFYRKQNADNIINLYTNQHSKNIDLIGNKWPIVSTHPNQHISNFETIATDPNYFQFHIIQKNVLNTGHTVAIIKTHYIRLVQRAWKKLFSIRRQIYQERNKIQNRVYKDETGEWPETCRRMPTPVGILRK
tara:strand:- start:846 stop:1370 length:525 start_codon:yes stop_codon:yes gene_type:complete